MCLFAIHISSLVKCFFHLLPIFQLGCLFSYGGHLIYILLIESFIRYMIHKYFLHCFFCLSSLVCIQRAEVLNFHEFQFNGFFLLCNGVLVLCSSLCLAPGCKYFSFLLLLAYRYSIVSV